MQAQPYSQGAVSENESLIASKAANFVKRAITAARASTTGKNVDVYTLCGLFSLEVVLQCAFNHDSGEAADGDSLKLLHAMDKAAQTLPIQATVPMIGKLGIGRYLPGFAGVAYRGLDEWAEMTRSLIAQFQQEEKALDKSHRFMVTPLLVNSDDFLGRRLTEAEVLEESMGIAFAGSGTTSTTLTYLIYAMSRPEAAEYQAKLRKELQKAAAMKGAKLRLKELQDLPFLNAVIKETMRLYPTIISTLPRTLEAPLELTAGQGTRTVVLPPGVDVGMQNYVHHQDRELFPEPGKFMPERWLDDSDPSRLKDMQSALTPFSVGPRNCIGQNLARAELYLAVSEIFGRLGLQLNDTMAADDMFMEDRFNIAPRGRRLVVDVDVL
ncbi:hypothetical protein H2201_006456 [Coniosporium apollinis]|uniref:Cytochrome P450 monooxygenase n=1 Tax=Coniosporium apollinis TaxID=61459 RepID=A0ABQ9NLW4_9PEZI|nr:hypothetical protein H2201_006456 [Coniosporium apollinis]